MATNNAVLILIVLYKQNLEDSSSYKSLCQNIDSISFPYEVLVYNNTPSIKIPESDFYAVFNSSENQMLVGAYNYALEVSRKKKFDWLLLLDQDTQLTSQYFLELSNSLNSVSEGVGAILPSVISANIKISPMILSKFFGPFGIKKPYSGTEDLKKTEYVSGINSATILRTKAITKIGGFSKDFPLDFSDHWYFFRLYQLGYSVNCLRVAINHDLSVAKSYNPMGVKRYIQYLEARYLFAKKTSFSVMLALKLRSIIQCISQLLKKSERKFFFHTFRAIFR